MKKKSLIWILALMSVFVHVERVGAYSTAIHERITQRVIGQMNEPLMGERLNKYINDYMGLSNGVREFVDQKQIGVWIERGSRKEDFSFNPLELLTSHYHNPITNRGLTKGGVTIGESAYDRANKPTNDWSWQNARENLYKGLTLLTKTEREKALAKSFEALGHLVHLVQDMSVPAHTRDDMHVPYVDGEPYEAYTDNEIENLNYAAEPFLYWNVSISPYAPKHFWDTDTYNENTPPYSSGYIGLSEYTNANFFSKATIFKNFPHPAKENTNYTDFSLLPIVVITTPDNISHETLYVRDKNDDQKIFAGLRYFADELWNSAGLPETKKYVLTLHLDNRCHVGYASALIPRAVGYSAGLLDYFFRGKLEVTAVPVFERNRITYLRAKIKNLTPNETMRDGTFTLTYSYTDGSDVAWAQAPMVLSGTLEYGGDEQHPVEETVIDFLLPTPIPKESYDSAKLTLAFWGTLGNEVGAVIGKALTLGEIKFGEEWDNGLTGNNNWGHVGYNVFGWNPNNGTTTNTIVGDTLIKENNRYMGVMSARVNESFVDYDYNNGEFRDKLPILITKDTYLQFKIDAMSINHIPPAPPGYSNHWQALILDFSNGLSLQYFQPGQGICGEPNSVYLTFPLGQTVVHNIYDMFKGEGITVPEPLNLEGISFLQQLFMLDEPSTVYHRQYMEIDSIRIIEGKKQ